MIKLEYFTQNDFEQLTRWINSEELLINWAGSLFRFPLSSESLHWYIDDTNDLHTSDALVYKAIEVDTGQSIGHISLGSISRKNRSARISRVLIGETNVRGKGYCQQMVQAVCRIGFEELQLHRISLGVYDFNHSAINCYKKAGFVVEGTSRDVLWHNRSFWSLIEMSMLEEEWHALHK